VPVVLFTTIGNILDELGEFAKSKALRMRIRDQIHKTVGIGHPYYLQSIMEVASSQTQLREWMEAQQLHEEILMYIESTIGQDHPDSLSTVLVQSRRMSLRGETGPFTESHPQ
jgi:hypothetical protein